MSAQLIENCKLPQFLHPNPDGMGFRYGYNAMLLHTPLLKLPRGMLARKDLEVVTPKFVFGYSITVAELKDFADRHNLLAPGTMIETDDYDPDHDYDPDQDSVIQGSSNEIRDLDLARKVFDHLQDTLEIKSFKLSWEAIRLSDLGVGSAMVITSNWKFNRSVQQDELEKLQQGWKPNERPMWYPVIMKCTWMPKRR